MTSSSQPLAPNDPVSGPDFDYLARVLGAEALAARPSLFSGVLLDLDAGAAQAMADLVATLGRVAALPAYRRAVLGPGAGRGDFPDWALARAGQGGVCLGYDFHLGPDGPRLIEINTNAGGLLLVAALRAAWGEPAAAGQALTETVLAMFRAEWATLDTGRPLTRVAIVDEDPDNQYLAPEFQLYATLFRAAGIAAEVVDPAQLVWDGQVLSTRQHPGEAIDLVYNRLTDFALKSPAAQPLAAAWQAGGAVVSPNPLGHALFADKRNLILLSNPESRAQLGLDPADEAVLAACLPATRLVTRADADLFWAERKAWFFKPGDGFGSKAAYRGDKLTKRVFEEILESGRYVAQALVPPGEVLLSGQGEADGENPIYLKYDLRNFAYAGKVQCLAARLYQGQTTNFRTPGGGFAPVRVAGALA